MSTNAVRKRLRQERDGAIARLRDLGGPVGVPETPSAHGANVAADEVEQVQANEFRELGFMSRERLTARISRLTAALERVDNGTYGQCVECGEPIEPARLRAIPEAETCIRDQERLEQKRRLGGQSSEAA